MRKRYITSNYKLQVLLSEVEGIEIVDIVERNWNEKTYKDFVFEFPANKGSEVHNIKEILTSGGYKVIDNFNDLKNKRKELLDKYFDRLRGENYDS